MDSVQLGAEYEAAVVASHNIVSIPFHLPPPIRSSSMVNPQSVSANYSDLLVDDTFAQELLHEEVVSQEKPEEPRVSPVKRQLVSPPKIHRLVTVDDAREKPKTPPPRVSPVKSPAKEQKTAKTPPKQTKTTTPPRVSPVKSPAKEQKTPPRVSPVLEQTVTNVTVTPGETAKTPPKQTKTPPRVSPVKSQEEASTPAGQTAQSAEENSPLPVASPVASPSRLPKLFALRTGNKAKTPPKQTKTPPRVSPVLEQTVTNVTVTPGETAKTPPKQTKTPPRVSPVKSQEEASTPAGQTAQLAEENSPLPVASPVASPARLPKLPAPKTNEGNFSYKQYKFALHVK